MIKKAILCIFILYKRQGNQMYYLINLIVNSPEEYKKVTPSIQNLCVSSNIEVLTSYKNIIIVATKIPPNDLATHIKKMVSGLEFLIVTMYSSSEFKNLGGNIYAGQGSNFLNDLASISKRSGFAEHQEQTDSIIL